jgi:hypothetical protein
VVIELKIGMIIPEYAGKLNFFLSAVDDLLHNRAIDKPSIGILLCKERNRVIAEYALQDMAKPMAVTTYQLEEKLTTQFAMQLPSTEKHKEAILKGGISATSLPRARLM